MSLSSASQSDSQRLLAGQGQQEGGSLARDEVYSLLSNSRRRFALHAIKRADEDLKIAELAEQVAAWENAKEISEITSNERHRVYTSMQQVHLPTMDRAGIIDFDNRTVSLTAEADQLDVYMDVVPAQSIPWGQYYLGLSVLAGALVGAVWTGVFPSTVPDLAWATLVIVAFFISALYHVWHSGQMRLGEGDLPPEVRE